MIPSRRVTILITVGLLFVACSSNQATSTTPAIGRTTGTQTTGSATSGTGQGDRTRSDVARIVEEYAARSAAWDGGPEAALADAAASAYPAGEWAPEMITQICRTANPGPNGTLGHEAWMAALEDLGYRRTMHVVEEQIRAAPDFVIPAGQPGAGTVPKGRVYRVAIDIESNSADDDGRREYIHVVVTDEAVRWIPGGC